MLGTDFINDLIMLRKFLSILNLFSALLIMKECWILSHSFAISTRWYCCFYSSFYESDIFHWFSYFSFFHFLAVPRGLQDLTRDRTWVPTVKVLSPKHWTAREFRPSVFLSNHSCIPRINPTLFWHIILLIYCWILFVDILLRISASIFIRDIGLLMLW